MHVRRIFSFALWLANGVNEWDGDGPHLEDYHRAKRLLIFANLVQDGTGEGVFLIDRLPNESEAAVVRDVFGILRLL
jgi:hypothetical protein